jgi:hypothetical protein
MTKEIQLPSKWVYVLRGMFTPLIKWLPAWILKKIYPITRCIDMIHVLGDSIGPHVYINDERPSKTIELYKIMIINNLPFPITVEYLNLDINIESLKWISGKQIMLNDKIEPSGGKKEIPTSHDLTGTQANTIRDYPTKDNPSQCPMLVYTGSVRVKSPVGNFDKGFRIETRAFVFKG